MKSNGSRNGGGVDKFIDSANPSIPLTRVYERKNARGRRYLTGRIGIAKVLIVETDELSDGDRIWQVFLAQGPYSPENAAALAAEAKQGGAR